MAKVAVIKKQFTDDGTGVITPYERLSIAGYVNGEYQSLELKLSKAEMLLAKIILSSKEEEPVVNSHNVTDEEEDEFLSKNSGRNSDRINLEDEDE